MQALVNSYIKWWIYIYKKNPVQQYIYSLNHEKHKDVILNNSLI